MIQTTEIWTRQSAKEQDRLDVYVTESGVFDPASAPGRFDFRGTGYRELAKAIFEGAPHPDQPEAVQLGEQQYTHLVGRIEREGDKDILVINPSGSNVGLMRGSGVAGAVVRGWNPGQDADQTEV